MCVISGFRTFTVTVVRPRPMSPATRAHARRRGLRDGFVERLRRHVQRMSRVVQIVDEDSAGFERHDGNSSIRYLFALPLHWFMFVLNCSLRASILHKFHHGSTRLRLTRRLLFVSYTQA